MQNDFAQRLYLDEEVKPRFLEKLSAIREASDGNHVEVFESPVILPLKKRYVNDVGDGYYGGMIDNEGNYIPFSEETQYYGCWVHEGGNFNWENAVTIDKEVVFGGIAYSHFGHFLVESVTNLWYWLEHPELDIAYLPSLKEGRMDAFCWDFFDMLGIDRQRIHIITEPTRFRKVYMPQSSHFVGRTCTDKFATVYRQAALNAKNSNFKRVYLSRSKFRGGVMVYGEHELEKLFRRNGFNIIYPEKLSLKEQVAAVNGAEIIAGVSGSAMHLALFAPKGAKVIELARSDFPLAEQFLINRAVGADWYIASVSLNPFPSGHAGPCLLGVTRSLTELCEKLGFDLGSRAIGQASAADCKKFVKAYLRTRQLGGYCDEMNTLYPLYARRFQSFGDTYAPLSRRIKTGIRNFKHKWLYKIFPMLARK